MNARQLSIVIAAVTWSSAVAFAATQGAPEPGKSPSSASSLFEQLDQNKDALVDMSEAGRSAQVKGDFKKIDANNDGKISRDEWERFSTTQGNSPR